MIETLRLKNIVIFIETILSFVLTRKIDKYTKSFYNIKNYRYISASEIKKERENLNQLENLTEN